MPNNTCDQDDYISKIMTQILLKVKIKYLKVIDGREKTLWRRQWRVTQNLINQRKHSNILLTIVDITIHKDRALSLTNTACTLLNYAMNQHEYQR